MSQTSVLKKLKRGLVSTEIVLWLGEAQRMICWFGHPALFIAGSDSLKN
jgi:hypothetical protein